MSELPPDPIDAAIEQLDSLRASHLLASAPRSAESLLEVLGACRRLQQIADSLTEPVIAVLRRLDVPWQGIATALALDPSMAWDRYHTAEGAFGVAAESLLARVSSDQPAAAPQLRIGNIYTRAELKTLFSITDATINNGVFPFRENNEVWLFVTEQKQADRVQYRDKLAGDELQWQGQSTGRTDDLVINHSEHGSDILVFYRERKYQYPGAGFRFEGRFGYVRHWGSAPTSFILKRLT